MSERTKKVNELIKREVSQLFLRELDFPRDILVTITRVETAANLIQSKVYVSIMPEEKSLMVLRILKNRIYDIQQKINKRLAMRPVPRIKFMEEKKTKSAERIEELLEKIKE